MRSVLFCARVEDQYYHIPCVRIQIWIQHFQYLDLYPDLGVKYCIVQMKSSLFSVYSVLTLKAVKS
jgi:hypothetical protein